MPVQVNAIELPMDEMESLLKRTSPAAEAGTRAEFTSSTGEVDRQSDSERELLQVLRHGN